MNRFSRWTMLVVLILSLAPSVSRAELILYTAFLDGPSEWPPVESPGIGFATVGFDPVAHSLAVTVVFGNLIGTTTVAHIHGPTDVPFEETAGVVTMLPSFTDFPTDVHSGVYARIFDTNSEDTYNPAFFTASGGTTAGAEARLAQMLAEGTAYFNIHTSAFPPGEIRGLLRQVPEPSGLALMGIGGTLGLVACTRRRHRKR